MRLKFLVTVTLLVLALSAKAQQDSSFNFFDGNFDQAQQKATEEEKIIYAYVCADWAEICNLMPYSTFRDPSVAKTYNKAFICMSIDIEKHEDKNEFLQYSIRNMPTHLFLDAHGNMLHRSVGSKSPEEMLKMAETALDPDERFAEIEKQYLDGERSEGFLRKYIWAAWDAGADYQAVADQLFVMIEKEDYSEEETWKLVTHFMDHTGSPAFSYILENRKELGKELGHSNVRRKIDMVFSEEVAQKLRMAGGGSIDSYLEESFKPFADIEGIGEIRMATALYLYSRAGDINHFSAMALRYAELYGATDPATFGDIVLFYQSMKEAGKLSREWENPPPIVSLRAEINTLMSQQEDVEELIRASEVYFKEIAQEPIQSDMGGIITFIVEADSSDETIEWAENWIELGLEKDPRNYYLFFASIVVNQKAGDRKDALKAAEETLHIAETEGLGTAEITQYVEQLRD